MPKLTEAELKTALKTEQFMPVYLLMGNESYLVRHYARRLADTLVGEHMPDFNLSTLSGEGATVRAVLEAAEALPMMHRHRCVLVRDPDPADWEDAEMESLIAYFRDPCPGNVVVIACETVTPAANGQWKTLTAACEQYGGVIRLNKKTDEELKKILCAGAGQRGCTLSADTAEYLVGCVGNDMHTLLRELEKLCAYRPGQPVTRQDVDLLCCKTLSANAFEVVKAINRQNGGQALGVLRNLLSAREEPVAIMGALASSYANLYRAITADDAHLQPEAFGQSLGLKKPAALRYSLNDARKMGKKRLLDSLALLARRDEQMKRLPVDGAALLEQTVVELLAMGNKP